MIEILYFIPIILVCYGFGAFIFKLFKFEFNSSLEKSFFSIAIGLFFYSFLTMVLGFLGYLYKPLFYLIFILGLIIFSKQIISLISNIISFFNKFRLKYDIFTFLAAFLAILILFNLIATMVPPWEIDTVLYHATLPKVYSMNHKIVYTPYDRNSFWPLFMEMLYLIGTILKNGILGKLFAWFSGVLVTLAIISFCKRFFSKNIGIIAAAIFYTTPLVMQFNTTGMVDISLGFFIFMAYYSFSIWFSSQKTKWLVLSAIFAGVSSSIKINGSFPMIILALGIFYRLMIYGKASLKNLKKSILLGILFTVIMYFIFAPWLIRNYVWTGNPFFPFLYNVFGGKYWSLALTERLNAGFNEWGLGKSSMLGFFMLPFYATFFTQKFGELLGIGPIYLAFVPLVFFIKRKKMINYLLIFSFLSITLWFFFFSRQLRLLQFIFPYLAIVAAYVIIKLLKPRFRKIILLLFISYLLFSGLIWVGANGKQIKRGLLLESDEDFLSSIKTDHNYADFKYINSNVQNISIILFYDKISGYYSDYPYVISAEGQGYIRLDMFNNSAEMRKELKSFGISHIMVGGMPVLKYRYSNETRNVMADLLNSSLIIYQSKDAKLYKI